MNKRYQYFGKDGITWTKWFHLTFNKETPKYQLGRKLLNEYEEDKKIKE